MIFTINGAETGLAIWSGGLSSIELASSGNITAALEVEYIDASGVRQTTEVVDGVTSISGIAPLLVKFNASDTRLDAAYAAQGDITDEEAYAWLMGSYRFAFGEGSGNWAYPAGTSFPVNQDTGHAMTGHIFRTAGTYNTVLTVKDALGNTTAVTVEVVVSAPVTTVNIPVSAGAWPTFVSNRRYTLDAGGNYTGFGGIDTGGLNNIIFEKTGVGTDPIIAEFTPDGRSKFSAVSPFEYRASHIRLIGIEIEHFLEGQRGFEYVALMECTLNRYTNGGQSVLWQEGTDIIRSNVRHARGFFLENSELRSNVDENGYIIIGTYNGFFAHGCRFVHAENGPTTYAMLRIYGRHMALRNNLWTCEVNGGSGNGTTISMLALDGLSEVTWRDDDLVGPVSGTVNNQRYGYTCDKYYMQDNQIWDAGSFFTNGITSCGGGNPEGSSRCRPRLMGWENNVFYPVTNTTQGGSGQGELYGQYNYWRNNARNMGAGTQMDASTGAPNASVGDTTTFNGPFFEETTNTRPTF
jgi:hypothetical protein